MGINKWMRNPASVVVWGGLCETCQTMCPMWLVPVAGVRDRNNTDLAPSHVPSHICPLAPQPQPQTAVPTVRHPALLYFDLLAFLCFLPIADAHCTDPNRAARAAQGILYIS